MSAATLLGPILVFYLARPAADETTANIAHASSVFHLDCVRGCARHRGSMAEAEGKVEKKYVRCQIQGAGVGSGAQFCMQMQNGAALPYLVYKFKR